ncbi:MAG: Zn-ribbon domain-containing OB-fold protein [Xanthobacteraceae bacterium]
MTITAAEGQAPDTVFRAYLSQNELWLQTCTGCAKQIFFPRVLCPYCGSGLEWRKAATTGTVYSATTVRQRPDRGGDYNIAIVELDEGARMMSRVEGVSPDEVDIGMKVKAIIEERDGGPIVLFQPLPGGAR